MKNTKKYLPHKYFLLFLFSLAVFFSNCLYDDDDNSPAIINNTRQEIDSLKTLMSEALSCPNQFILSSPDQFLLGEIYTESRCQGIFGLHSFAGNLAEKYSTQVIRSIEKPINERTGSFEWTREGDQTVGLKVVDFAIKAALSLTDKDVQRLSISFTFQDPKIIQLQDPRGYQSIISNSDQILDGNVYITEVLRSKFKMEYTAYNSSDQEIDIDLTPLINEQEDSTYNTFGEFIKTVSQMDKTYVVESAGNAEITIAVCYQDIPSTHRNTVTIDENNEKFCDSPKDPISIKTLEGRCTDSLLLSIKIEESINKDEWLFEVENLTSSSINFYKFNLEIRNGFGQFITQVNNVFRTNGISLNGEDKFTLNYLRLGLPNPIPDLSELSVKLAITDLKFVEDPFVNFCQ